MRGCDLILAGAELHVMNVSRVWDLGGSIFVFYKGLKVWEAPSVVFYEGLRLWEVHLYVFYVSGKLSGGLGFNAALNAGGSAKERPSRAWGERVGGSICCVLRGSEALGGSFVRVLPVGEVLGGSDV